jgi:hypothetical protein
MAKHASKVAASEHKLEGFAEDLGHLLGTATGKAEKWLSQRKQIVKHLTEVRDTASKLLNDLGQQASAAVAAGTRAYEGKRRGRPVGSKNQPAGIIIFGGKKKRTMSAKARKAISKAQKARWAKQKAGDKKK